MSAYVWRGSGTGRRLQELQEQKARDAEHIRVIDEQNREILARRKQHRKTKATETNNRPVEDVHAEAETIRQRAVNSMTVAYYNQGAARLRAATDETLQAQYVGNRKASRNQQGRFAA